MWIDRNTIEPIISLSEASSKFLKSYTSNSDVLNLLVDLGGEILAVQVVGFNFQLAQAFELAVHWSRITLLEHAHQQTDARKP